MEISLNVTPDARQRRHDTAANAASLAGPRDGSDQLEAGCSTARESLASRGAWGPMEAYAREAEARLRLLSTREAETAGQDRAWQAGAVPSAPLTSNPALLRSLALLAGTAGPSGVAGGDSGPTAESLIQHARAARVAIDESMVAAANLDPRTFALPREHEEWEPGRNMWEIISGAQGIVGRYGQIAKKMMDFLAELTAAMDKARGLLEFKEKDDKTIVTVNPVALALLFDTSKPGPFHPDKFKIDFDPPLSAEEVAQWEAEMGEMIEVAPDGSSIKIKTTLVDKIAAGLPKKFELSMPEYQAWYAGFTNYRDQLQMDAQRTAEGFSRATGNFDNLVRVLSNALASLTEMMKTQLAR